MPRLFFSRPSRNAARTPPSVLQICELERRELLAGDLGTNLVGEIVDEPQMESIAPSEVAPSIQSESIELVFIDSAVEDLEQFAVTLPTTARVVLIDSTLDPLSQITDAILAHRNVKTIHLISHGEQGRLLLASQRVGIEALNSHASLISRWAESLASGADILIYGCDVAASKEGRAFIRRFAELTGADVAASINRTGNSQQSADWDLELHVVRTNGIQATGIRPASDYQHTLALPAFTNFSNTSQLALNGTAQRNGSALELTPPAGGLGSAFFVDPLTVDVNTSFQTQFQFRIRDGDGNNGADGLTFVLQNSASGLNSLSATGGGGGLGIDGLPQSLAIEFDTYKNSYDIDNNHISVIVNGNVASALATNTALLDLNGGQKINAWVEYNGVNHRLAVYLSNDAAKPIDPTLTTEVDLQAIVGNQAFAGFTAATGGLSNRHELISWHLNTDAPALPPPQGLIGLAASQLSVSESGTAATITVLRAQGSLGAVSVGYQTSAGTATAGLDFEAVSGTIDFADGETSRTVLVPIFSDALFESGETFFLTLSNATGGAELAEPTVVQITIEEDNASLPSFLDFSDTSHLVTNGTAGANGNVLQLTPSVGGLGSVFFDRALVVDSETSFKTNFRFRIRDGQGTNGADGFVFMLQNNAAGLNTLTNTGGAGLGYAGVLNSLAIEFDTYQNAGDIDNNHLSVLVNGDVVTPLVTSTAPFDLNSGEVLHAWVEYNGPNNQLKVYLSNDDSQPDESLLTANVDLNSLVGPHAFVGFSAATGGLVNRHEVLSWIFDTEEPPYAPPQGIVGFDISQQSLLENSGQVVLNVIRARGSVGAVDVDYQTVAGTAIAGADFIAKTGSLHFAAAEKLKQVTIDLVNSVDKEPVETFSVQLSNLSGGAVFSSQTSTVDIQDDDVSLPSFADFFGVGKLTFNRDALRADGALVLTNDLGALGSAYFNDALPINADTSFQTQFQFRIDHGDGPGGADGFVFMLQNSPAGLNALASSSGGSLGYEGISNSLAVEFDTYRNPYDANDNHISILRDGNVVSPVAIRTGNPLPATASVPFDMNSGQPISVWIDYDGLNEQLRVYISDSNFKPLAPSLTAEVDLASIVGSQAYLGFSGAFGGLSNRHNILNWQFETAIPPTPPPGGVIGLAGNQFTVNEAAGTVTVNVLRALSSEGTVTVHYLTVPGFATPNDDYVPQSGALVFAPGETIKLIVIPILNDFEKEARETFQVTLDSVSGEATLLAPRTATVTIVDDDATLPQFTGFESAGLLSLNGSANVSLSALQLTPSFGGVGSAYFTDPLIVNSLTSFQTSFTFRIDQGDGASGADGFVFQLQNSLAGLNALSTIEGKGLGYWGILKSLAVEFDTYQNDWDLNGNHVSVFANGVMDVGAALGTATVPFDLNDGSIAHAWIDFNGGANQLAVYVAQANLKPIDPLLVIENINLESLVGNQAYAGFSAATGGLVNRHQILDWQLNTEPPKVITPSTGVQAIKQVIASGFNLPTSIDWSPNGQNLYVAEKQGVVLVTRNGAAPTTFIDISSQVNDSGDRGLLAVAVHPDFANQPYVYLLFTYDPPEVYSYLSDPLAGPDGSGNRASRLVRVTADAATNYTTAVAGSEIVLLGSNSVWQHFNAFVDSTVDFTEPPGGLETNGTMADFNGYLVLPSGETVLAASNNQLPNGTPITFSNVRDSITADSGTHSVGDLQFGSDGALYVSTGDGASFNARDPRAFRVQDLDNLSGKVLRINPLTGAGLADNPFFSGDATDNRSKVYQSGFRNPFRIAIDTQGQVYVGDVGWTTWEEINAGGPGANYGWPYFEGGNGNNLPTTEYKDLPTPQAYYASSGVVTPSLLSLNHGTDGINAIVLGGFYTGGAYGPDYTDTLFFNDLGRGLVRNVTLNTNGQVTGIRSFATDATYVVSMQQGPDGFLYYVDLDDGIVGRWIV